VSRIGNKRVFLLPAGAALSVPLGGCVPMMAASAVSMAAQAAEGNPQSNEPLQPQARDECTKQAAQYGAVHIIDVEQHSIAKIIVWGTVDDGKAKRSFECDYGTRITGFKLREIPQQSQ
jgi:hypothetical protein